MRIRLSDSWNGVGTAIDTVIESGGLQDVALIGGTGTASATVIDSGGTENVFSGGTITGTTISGGMLQLGSGAVVDGGITFSGSGGMLEIDGTAMPTNVISGLVFGDVIDLPNVTFSSGGSATLGAGNVLNIVEGGKTYQLHLNPAQNLAADSFVPSLDAGSGTKITFEPNSGAPTVVSATSPESGAYGVGRTVTFTLDMSLPAVVSGTPTLTLNDGGIASYVSGSGTDDLTFSYTVSSGQNASAAYNVLVDFIGRDDRRRYRHAGQRLNDSDCARDAWCQYHHGGWQHRAAERRH